MLLIVLLSIFCYSYAQESAKNLSSFALTNKLFNVSQPNGKNFVVSPYNVESALFMLVLATNSKQNMQQILERGFNISIGDIKSYVSYSKSLVDCLTENPDEDDVILKAHSILAINKKYDIEDKYIKRFQSMSQGKYFDVINGDFSNYGLDYVEQINKKVTNVTNGKIKDLLGTNSLNKHTVLPLINTVYLKGDWHHMHGFLDVRRSLNFRLEDRNSIALNAISGTSEMPYYEHKYFQAIYLNLQNEGDESKFGVYFLLPKAINGYTPLLERLVEHGLLNEFLKNKDEMKDETVRVTMPKFTIEYEDDLSDDLQRLGLTDLFEEGKFDFSKLIRYNPRHRLAVTEFKHKVYIKVDGNGVEAAGAVAASLSDRSSSPKPKKLFVADHPFIFYVTVRRQVPGYSFEHVLFSGQFTGH